MAKLRIDYHSEATRLIREDLSRLQVSERSAADGIGISNSTFNAFLNMEYRKAQSKTLKKLLDCMIWAPQTREALQLLRDYDANLFIQEVGEEPEAEKNLAA